MKKVPKKLLHLGDSRHQLPAFREAKKRGFYLIACDYLPENPGRELADEFYNISTTDKQKILSLAREKTVDYIFSYASDPAAETVSFVSEKLGLPGNPQHSVKILTNKGKFRKMLRRNGFNCPKFRPFKRSELHMVPGLDIEPPYIVKPVDSTDTRGVSYLETRIGLMRAAEDALCFSRSDSAIVEEYIGNETASLHGDGFVLNGVLEFCCLGDHLFTQNRRPFKPRGTLFPSERAPHVIEQVKQEVQKAIRISGFQNGPVNIEVRIPSDGKIYIMEIGPRNAGGSIPLAIAHSSGFDMIKASFDWLEQKPVIVMEFENPRIVICYTIHTDRYGVLQEIALSDSLKPYLVENYLSVSPGDRVKPYDEPNSSLGAYIFRFPHSRFETIYPDALYEELLSAVKLK